MTDNLKDTVREKAAELAGGAFQKQKGTALGELDSVASALRQAGSALGDNSGVAAKLVTSLADRVESAGRSLDGKELGDIVDDVERFARRNPATFISGAIAVGFLASRFLKSSASAVQNRPQTSTGGASTTTQSFAATGGGADVPMSTDSFSDTDDSDQNGVMDRPLIAGVAALAVGAIVGTIIRETDREHELFGRHREQLTSRALETARQTVARGVAQAASTVASKASAAGGNSGSSGNSGSNSGNSGNSNDKSDTSTTTGI
jgi:hypothetical protein